MNSYNMASRELEKYVCVVCVGVYELKLTTFCRVYRIKNYTQKHTNLRASSTPSNTRTQTQITLFFVIFFLIHVHFKTLNMCILTFCYFAAYFKG